MNNIYIRVYTGMCERLSSSSSIIELKQPCRDFGGGCDFDAREISERDLHLARDVLNSFNLVLISELLDNSTYVEYIAALLHLPLEAEKLSHLRGSELMKVPPTRNLHNELEADNSLDLVLYYAFRHQTAAITFARPKASAQH
jgi:hypothetical protein